MSICRVIVFQFLITIGHSTKECYFAKSERHLVNSLHRTLLQSTKKSDPNPAAFLSLHLATQRNLEEEKQIQQHLAEAAVKKMKEGEDLSSGLTALYVLAFRSACLNPADISDGHSRIDLVKHLNDELKKETQSLELNQQPQTNYYQVSLAILALCVEKQPVSDYVVNDLIKRIMNFKAPFIKVFSADTASMSALALSCLRRSPINKIPKLKIEKPIMQLLGQLLGNKQDDGTIGNIYSTGLAVQALIANPEVKFLQFRCSEYLERLISEIPKGTFDNVQRISHVVPALEGRTYLDVQNLVCASDHNNLPSEKD